MQFIDALLAMMKQLTVTMDYYFNGTSSGLHSGISGREHLFHYCIFPGLFVFPLRRKQCKKNLENFSSIKAHHFSNNYT